MKFDSYEEAASLLEKYPYFTYAAIRAIPLADDPAEADRMRMIAALNISDPEALARIPGMRISDSGIPASPAGTPADEETPDTADAIDTFLSRYAANSGADLPPLPYSPGEDAAELPPASDEESLIPDSPTTQETEISETSARILIKNRKYAEALAIIEHLNLKNPEKSIYFADQIRFLKKLIINQAKANC